VSGRLRWRVGSCVALVLVLGWFAASNFFAPGTRATQALVPDRALRLGLDLQGGIHWVLGVQLDTAVAHELEFVRGNLQQRLDDDKLVARRLVVENGLLLAAFDDVATQEKFRGFASDAGVLDGVESADATLRYRLTDEWQKEVRERGMRQVLEVMRRRIDDPIRGIPDSIVTRQGEDRILIQIPGGQIDRERARDLLETTGFLEFKLAQDQAPSEELLRGKYAQGLPEGTEIVSEIEKETQRKLTAYLVKETPDLTGDYLSDARVDFDQQQRRVVAFTFNTQGGKLFQELTGKHVGEQLAIVLDDRVYSAPVIRGRIGARGVIEGRFSPEEAADLAVVLRAGSLSVPVQIEEERTIGPGLGADSISKGLRASWIGALAVVFFMILYYRMCGAYACLALTMNMTMIFGVMSMFEATLTLPGIAGLVLTIGMGVDGNVIIFERIREELRAGKLPRAAIKTGFDKALWTILDSQATTLITALALYEYGTGPIKGFAVTLSIGLVTTVFSNVILTRLLLELYPGERRVEALSI
jgi:preprotein translocase subunit SecD